MKIMIIEDEVKLQHELSLLLQRNLFGEEHWQIANENSRFRG